MPHIIATVTNDLSHDQRMIRICSSLQAAGYEVTLVGRVLPDSPPLRERSFRQHRLRCWFHSGKLFYLEYQLRLLFYLYGQAPDIINAIDLDTLLPAYLMSRWRKIACVYDAHEYFTETPEVARRPMVQKVWSLLADWIIPQLQYCYTVGPGLAKLLGERYGLEFGVVRNVPLRDSGGVVEYSGLYPHLNHSRFPILYQGMLNEGRGLEVAVASVALLPADYTLWLVGKGDIMKKLQSQVKELGLERRVHFWGFQAPEKLPDITAQAWLGLNLLEARSKSYYYSLANKAFDYMQAGLPAVHMDFPEYRALAVEWGGICLLKALNPQALAQLIKQLGEDTTQYTQLKAENQRAAAVLHWNNEATTLVGIYNQIIAP